MKIFIFVFNLLFLCISNSMAADIKDVGPDEWANQILYEDSNALCGSPVPEIIKLQNDIRKIPNSLNYSQKVERLFKILRVFLSKNKMPITGGCHPGGTYEAINPEKLAELARGNKNAILEMEKIANNLRITNIALGEWYYYLAELYNFNSPRGKTHLDRAYQNFSKWFKTEDGGYNGHKIYQKVLELKGIQMEPMVLLAEATDNCGYGTAFWAKRKEIGFEEERWIRMLIGLAHNCCLYYPMVYPRLSLADVITMLENISFKNWAGSKIIQAVNALIKDYPDEESVYNLTSEFVEIYIKKQENLVKLVSKKFKIQRRNITGGNC